MTEPDFAVTFNNEFDRRKKCGLCNFVKTLVCVSDIHYHTENIFHAVSSQTFTTFWVDLILIG